MTTTNHSTAACLLGLYAVTPLHPGASGARGEIDLPVQKEAHTGWPVCFASGIKGAWREAARQKLETNEVIAVFGQEVRVADDTDAEAVVDRSMAGALAVTDAQVLLLPVRSLSSAFKWVTCPGVLQRFLSTCELMGLAAIIEGLAVPMAFGEDALCANEAAPDAKVLLEEFACTLKQHDLMPWVELLSKLSGQTIERLQRDLLVLSDEVFTYYCEFGLEVQAHVRLEPGTKTVTGGMLWWEETLSRDTLLYATPAGFAALRLSGKNILDAALSVIAQQNHTLRLGGNESLGMGWCKVAAMHAPKERA